MTPDQLLCLWGKTVRDAEGNCIGGKYHPLVFHLLDVGHVAQLLWDDVLSSGVRRSIARALNLSKEDARDLVVLLAALHDLGKAYPGFQFQEFRGEGPEYLRALLRGIGLTDKGETRPHGFISARVLNDVLQHGDWKWNAEGVGTKVLAHIAGAHHGTFPQSCELVTYSDDLLGGAKWSEARLALLDAAWNALRVRSNSTVLACGEIIDAAIVPILAGFISVADWLGSSQEFPAAASENRCPSIEDYIGESRNRAQKALEKFGWLPRPQLNRPSRAFAEIFPFAPNKLQEQVELLVLGADAPFLLIAEAAMGAGKTEAALFAADTMLCRAHHNGFYLALPTQATSNAMHARVRDDYFAHRDFKLNLDVALVHGNALLHQNSEIRTAPINEDDAMTSSNRAAAESWFAARKRPLLAPFGVGTIDQSLMGVLQTPHWFVRLFGLAGKIVIFDEVHAYDTYMSALLERLLQWLKILDCSVVLLSATLPKSKRHSLLESWGAKLSEEKPYPRLSWACGEDVRPIAIEDETSAKQIALKIAPTDAVLLAQTLRAKLENGGCAAVVCNTVNRAQEIFETLRHELSDIVPAEEFYLIHARMPFAWRQAREKTILRKFGKKKLPREENGARIAGRPQRAIVVGTQVMEQSLDLDFDWMASEMAPVDLLLQRMGRLQRHALDENEQPTERYGLAAQFVILCDADKVGAPPDKFGPYENTVYDRFILLRSWLAVRAQSTVEIPRDIEVLIEKVYEGAPEVDAEWQAALKNALNEATQSAQKAGKKAVVNLISPPEDEAQFLVEDLSRGLKDEDDPAIHRSLRAATRDGDPSISVVCLCRVGKALYLPGENGGADLLQPINESHQPDLAQSGALLKFSLPISTKRLYFALRDTPVPEGWRKSPHLRFHRALIFEDESTVEFDRTLHLDRTLGLVIKNEKASA